MSFVLFPIKYLEPGVYPAGAYHARKMYLLSGNICQITDNYGSTCNSECCRHI